MIFVVSAATVSAATWTVTKTADTADGSCNSDCSLREAIAAAAISGDNIVFATPLFSSARTILLADAAGFRTLLIEKSITIDGPGANLLTIRGPSTGPNKYRVIAVAIGLVVDLNGLTISGGDVLGDGGGISTFGSVTTVRNCHVTDNVASGGSGGGIKNAGGGTLNVLNSTVSRNIGTFSTSGAGGIHSDGTLNINNSTISDNTKTSFGYNVGGIYALGPTTITGSTITNNGASGLSVVGGVASNGAGVITIRNSIVAGNVNQPDISGFLVISAGYNLIGTTDIAANFNEPGDQVGTPGSPLDARLDPLGNYGGTTPTHRLQMTPVMSPAIDKGKSFGTATDQRGEVRPFDSLAISNAVGGDGSDIGAYEIFFTLPLVVTKTADTNDGNCDSDCSLREAINAAGSGNTIEFSPLFNTPQTITLSDTAGFRELAIVDKSITIAGKGAELLTIRRDPASLQNFRIFRIGNTGINPVNVTLTGMKITGGRTAVNSGAGIRIDGNQNSLLLESCFVTENSVISGAVSAGGGIQSSATLTIRNSTISNNTVSTSVGQGAGGIYSISSGPLTLTNSTVSGNSVTGSGNNNAGGVYTNVAATTNSTITNNLTSGIGSAGGVIGGGNTEIRGSIVAGNQNNLVIPDAGGAFISSGYNVIGNIGTATGLAAPTDQSGTAATPLDPRLDPLAFNGGPTPTHALRIGSPAIDAGNAFGIASDQRGSLRPVDNPGAPPAPGGDNSDVGSFESPRLSPLTVTKTADTNDGTCDSDCSLREAIAAASRGREIVFSSLFDSAQVITLSDAAGFQELLIEGKSMSIAGKGADLLTVRRDPASPVPFRIFRVQSDPSGGRVGLDLSGMTIASGRNVGAGGGLRLVGNENRLTLTNCVVTGNSSLSASGGGGIDSSGILTVRNSTVSNNTINGGSSSAGGIYSINGFDTGGMTLTNSTVSGNLVTGASAASAGGVQTRTATITNSTITDNGTFGALGASGLLGDGTTQIQGTIIAANRNNATVPDVQFDTSPFVSLGYNLIGSAVPGNGFVNGVNADQIGTMAATRNPMLDPLSNYGGTTPTHRPQFNSPVLDKGTSFGLTSDQRGSSRPYDMANVSNAGDGSDIGAIELLLGPSSAMVRVSGRVVTFDGAGLRNARVVITDAIGNTRSAISSSLGYYSFDEVAAGETYVITVVSKRYSFAPQIVGVSDSIDDLILIAIPPPITATEMRIGTEK